MFGLVITKSFDASFVVDDNRHVVTDNRRVVVDNCRVVVGNLCKSPLPGLLDSCCHQAAPCGDGATVVVVVVVGVIPVVDVTDRYFVVNLRYTLCHYGGGGSKGAMREQNTDGEREGERVEEKGRE